MASPVESTPAQARFSLQEVAQHSSPTDCWLIVRKKVYNVTPWVRRHPGGDILLVKAGRDCTYLFDSYHPLSARYSHPATDHWPLPEIASVKTSVADQTAAIAAESNPRLPFALPILPVILTTRRSPVPNRATALHASHSGAPVCSHTAVV